MVKVDKIGEIWWILNKKHFENLLQNSNACTE